MVHSPSHNLIHLSHFELLMDALRGSLFTHCSCLGLYFAEEFADCYDGNWLGNPSGYYVDLRSSEKYSRRRR